MLAQGPAPDPRCKLNISSFFTLSYLLDCLIYARDIMIIVLLLQMMEEWEGWGRFIYVGVWVGEKGWVSYFSILCYAFVLLLIVLSWLVHDSCCVCFIVSFWLSLPLVPLISHN